MRAICLSCGADKVGALAGCRACGKMPNEPVAEAYAVLASEEHLDDAGLDALAEQVRAGTFDPEAAFDPEVVQRLAAELEAVPHAPASFVLLVIGGPVLVLLLLAGGLMVAILLLRG